MTREQKARVVAHLVSDTIGAIASLILVGIMVLAGAPTWAWLTAGLIVHFPVSHSIGKELGL